MHAEWTLGLPMNELHVDACHALTVPALIAHLGWRKCTCLPTSVTAFQEQCDQNARLGRLSHPVCRGGTLLLPCMS
jgi:hypothetical protein